MKLRLRRHHSVNAEGKRLWKCVHCGRLKTKEEFGLRRREDAYPGQDVYGLQSWCVKCRGE
jgi:hypothetical protein